ncbi:MAG: dTDP-4-dehydrorhamnose reductase [Bdellovibrionaceae bacterium]|nr:dTDP-4-dehydrorhamnose reductase [Pseudobdellovibrionaceae bacterium]
MKILIFGENGQLAQEFKKLTSTNKDVHQVGRSVADFLNPDQVVRLIREYKPTHIINTSAYTAVDKAESEQAAAMHINGLMPGIIGETAKKIDASVTHFSTDYVFNGRSSRPYVETDSIDPVNYYGLTKSVGDKNLSDTGCHHQIYRVSWVYGVYGNNFLKTMLRLGSERPELKIVSDQHGAPTASLEIAEAAWRILKDKQLPDKDGIYHMAPQGETTWFDFTQTIFDRASYKKDQFKIITESVVPITSDQFVSAAKRPKYSLLSSRKLKSTFGVELPEWNESLDKVFKLLIAAH